MKFDPEKFFRAIDVKLRGRTAVFAIGQATLAVALWLVLKDYAAHSLFSTIAGATALAGMIGLFILGLAGKVRPDEVSEKSFTHIEQMGISIVHGISSQKDMVRIMREISGLRRLPPPSHLVHGSAANERDRVPLTSDQSTEIADQIERGVEKLLIDAVRQATSQDKQDVLSESSIEKPDETAMMKGKILD